MLDGSVLVLNQNYEPLSVCHARRAIILVLLGKAEIVEKHDKQVNSVSMSLPLPSVVRLSLYIRAVKRDIALNRKNILKRDNHTCQYCGKNHDPLTTDHVVPKSQGGKESWDNLVTACIRCNNLKGDRTPEQAGLTLRVKPKKPHRYAYIRFFSSIPDDRWKPYLFLD
jgi:5-methylcytosine-specific restriction endonuclease McrA